HAQIDCLVVDGNEAWVSGIITSGTFNGADLTGLSVVARIQDNGKSANDPPDAISASFIAIAPVCTDRPNLPLNPMTDGQVTVR
ncbi:MAG TPA: hypothetical protein VFN91_14080, partial [Myxococcaceae bacterium]|nr:hypothetical protein [Myxococcaceae bacterium]